jgi:hypothetical protein
VGGKIQLHGIDVTFELFRLETYCKINRNKLTI